MKQMDKVVAKFASHAEARKADREYYLSLTPAERIDILLTLVERPERRSLRLAKDLSEFIRSLNSHDVEYVVVGGYALAFHAAPRLTGDIDLLLRRSPENAAKVEQALNEFGFGSLGLSARDFLDPIASFS